MFRGGNTMEKKFIVIILIIASMLLSSCSKSKPTTTAVITQSENNPMRTVQDYISYISEGKLESAFDLIASYEKNMHYGEQTIDKLFMKQQIKEYGYETIENGPILDTYKFYTTQMGHTQVATVKITIDKEQKVIHLIKDDKGNWQGIWDPDKQFLE
jgi:cell shape-determining protein MreC